MAQSYLRRMKREAKQKQHLTFSERVTESIRTGTPIKSVEFEVAGGTSATRHLIAKEVV
jgi:hypothetical protein